MKVKNWLITGGCGFIGKAFIKMLLELEPQANIRVVDNQSVGTKEELGEYVPIIERNESSLDWVNRVVEFIEGNILNEKLAVLVSDGADVIVHLAANTGVLPSIDNPRMDCMSNVIGVFNYLDAARQNGVKSFVLASSGAAVGQVVPPINEQATPNPASPYGASKLAGEGYCQAFYQSYGLLTKALRFSNVYGPGSSNKNSIVAKFIKRSINKEVLEIYGTGEQTRDFIYLDDLLMAIYKAAKSYVGGEVFQIASHHETTVNEITKLLVERLNEKGIEGIQVVYGDALAGEVMRNYADTSKAKEELGWTCEKSLTEGLDITIDWFLNDFEL